LYTQNNLTLRKTHTMKNRENLKMIYELPNNKRRILFEDNGSQSWIILDLNDSKDYCHYQYYNNK
jgi:hypothetical protein